MNVLKPSLQTTIKTLLSKKISKREIERKTGINRKTIRRYAAVCNPSATEEAVDSKSPTSSEVATWSGNHEPTPAIAARMAGRAERVPAGRGTCRRPLRLLKWFVVTRRSARQDAGPASSRAYGCCRGIPELPGKR